MFYFKNQFFSMYSSGLISTNALQFKINDKYNQVENKI